MITIIVAYTRNHAIGKDNNLLYHISDDLKRFKSLTTGNTVIMGRKTFESLPKGALPNRRNIVVTHQSPDYENVEIAHSLDEAIRMAQDDNVFIIGGGSIYHDAMDIADHIYATEIDSTIKDADTFFPEIDEATWEIEEEGEPVYNEKNNIYFRFVNYRRK